MISVITVCLNAGAFLEQTIQSVLSQTYPRLEYIIIDGGSTDGTVEVIRRHEPSLAYWHSRPDRGLTHAFNLGLAQAHGDWILYLNADDYLGHSEVIAGMAPHLLRHPNADVVFGRIALVPREGSTAGSPPKMYGEPWRWRQFRFVCNIPHQAAFTRRRYFERVGTFDERFRIAADYEHYLRGGPNLIAIFVPQTVSVMRAGGLSLDNVHPTVREWRIAQTLNKAASPFLIWGNYLARSLSVFLQEKIIHAGRRKKTSR